MINQDPVGTPKVEVVNNATPAADVTVRAVTVGITDANNANADGTGGTFTYEWQESDGTAKGGQISRDYILTADDVTAIDNGTPPQVEVTYTDGLGFVHNWTVPFNAVNVSISQTNANLQANVADTNNVVRTSGRTYQWLQSATESGPYTAISGVGNVASYTVPANYGTTHPFVRVSLDYFNTDQNRQANVVSSPIRVAGVQSGGTVGIDAPTNVGVGGVVNSDISNLVNVLGRAVRAEDLTYQWYSGDGSIWTTIAYQWYWCFLYHRRHRLYQ